MEPGWGGNLTLALVSALAAIGFVAGASRLRFARAPGIAVAAIIAGYVTLLVVAGAYVAACSSCTSHISDDSSRVIDLFVAILWGGLFTAGIVLCISAGSLAATLWRRLLR